MEKPKNETPATWATKISGKEKTGLCILNTQKSLRAFFVKELKKGR